MTKFPYILCGLCLCLSLFSSVQSQSQPVSAEESENNFREDFLLFDDGLDTLATGSTRKREEIFKYCLNIHDQAKEARHQINKTRLEAMQLSVDEKLVAMEARIKELKDWTERREKFLERANETLVEIFRSMRADAAALQLTEVGSVTAASIISKLEPKHSSAILAEMKPDFAAKITMVLTNAMVKENEI